MVIICKEYLVFNDILANSLDKNDKVILKAICYNNICSPLNKAVSLKILK